MNQKDITEMNRQCIVNAKSWKFVRSIFNLIWGGGGETEINETDWLFLDNLIIFRANWFPTFSCLLAILSQSFLWICVTRFAIQSVGFTYCSRECSGFCISMKNLTMFEKFDFFSVYRPHYGFSRYMHFCVWFTKKQRKVLAVDYNSRSTLKCFCLHVFRKNDWVLSRNLICSLIIRSMCSITLANDIFRQYKKFTNLLRMLRLIKHFCKGYTKRCLSPVQQFRSTQIVWKV